MANLPCLAFNSTGTLALQCLSCQTWHNVANAGRAGSSSPFRNWLQHLYTLKHEKARVQLLIARSRLRRVTRAPKVEGREGTRGCPLSTTFGE